MSLPWETAKPTRGLVQKGIYKQTVVAFLLSLIYDGNVHCLALDSTELSLNLGANTLCHLCDNGHQNLTLFARMGGKVGGCQQEAIPAIPALDSTSRF